MSAPKIIDIINFKIKIIQIESTDRQIDKLVYELYSLTDDEIKVVEGEGK
ncbi:MAG: hypothetical protein HZB41_00010 [Ignavibacteriae bacterium]|nr:hypothetical protein [Ignavibacteriota bacterium]